MKKYIVVTTQFPAIHCWPECSIPEVGFLKYPHRHLFHVTVKWRVIGNDRELEFITKKDEVEQFVGEHFWNKDIGPKSCETIAYEIIQALGAQFVSVYEDGENGAEVYND